jgi:hypothetical protein
MSQIRVQLSSWFRIRNPDPVQKARKWTKRKTFYNCFVTLDRCFKNNFGGNLPVTAAFVADKIKKKGKN